MLQGPPLLCKEHSGISSLSISWRLSDLLSSGQADQGSVAHSAGLHTEDGQLLHQSDRMGLRGTWGPRWVPERLRRGALVRCDPVRSPRYITHNFMPVLERSIDASIIRASSAVVADGRRGVHIVLSLLPSRS